MNQARLGCKAEGKQRIVNQKSEPTDERSLTYTVFPIVGQQLPS